MTHGESISVELSKATRDLQSHFCQETPKPTHVGGWCATKQQPK